jgi:hypothetical protein
VRNLHGKRRTDLRKMPVLNQSVICSVMFFHFVADERLG